ncbi:MAG: efflux RND transporter periplasmic adaptor subunit [Pseudomonadota bacterium]
MTLPLIPLSRRLLSAVAVAVMASTVGATPVCAQDAAKKSGPPPSPVRIATAESREVSNQITIVGTVEAIATSIVASEGNGVVASFSVKEGDSVKKGDLLVTLRSTDLVLQRKATVAVREMTRVNLERARKELDRQEQLKAANSVAERSYDDALSSYGALAAELQRREAELELLDYRIAQTRVTAPFDGLVSDEHTQVGQWINTGGSVVTLIDISHVYVTVDVPERYAVHIPKGAAAGVIIRSVNTGRMPASVQSKLPLGNAIARTFPLRVELANPDLRLRPGMEAIVSLDLDTRKIATLVPKDAVVSSGASHLVYTVAEGKAVPLPVDIDGYYNGHVAVKGPVTPGMPVVTRGNERLRPGQAVQVTE